MQLTPAPPATHAVQGKNSRRRARYSARAWNHRSDIVPEHLKPVSSSLALDTASAIVDAAIAERRRHDLLPLAVAVLDGGGNLVAFKREDGCGVLRFDIAVGKAWGALGMGMSSRLIRDRLKERPAFQGALAAASG